jgi:integrase
MIYKRGKQGTYWIRFRFAGRFVHESTRTTSKTLAREAERQRRRELERKWNRIEKRSLPPTLTKAAKSWLEKRAGLASNTRETYEGALKHLREILGTMLVCEIEARDIVTYQKARLAQFAAGATINKEIACLSSILGECGVWEQVRRDVKRLDENEEAGRALSRDEEKRLLECAPVIGRHFGNWTPLYAVTVLGLNTGMRHKEIRTLKWKNLDLPNRVLRVGESKTEAGKGRPIPLTQPAWASLDMWASRFPDRKLDHFVFPACENGRIDPERSIANWRTAWRRACREAGLNGLRFHDLRHTAATKLLEEGTPIAVVAHILGWSASTAVRMAKRYGHIRPDVQRQALDAVATAEIRPGVNQIVHQVENALESKLPN